MATASTSVGAPEHPGGDDLMDFLASAVANRIVFVEGNEARFIEADRPTIQRKTTLSEVPLLLADAYDVVLLKNTSAAVAIENLLDAWNRDRALRMLDIILDRESDKSELLEASK